MARPKEESINSKESSKWTDPTENVIQLVNAAVKRLDDLSEVRYEGIKNEVKLNKEILDLHVSYGEKLRSADEKLSSAESKRIDAIRAVDVGAVAIASEKQTAQAAVLANQLTASADTLRNLVATTATTVNEQFKSVTNQLNDKIALLEKSQYVGMGKERVTDPMMDKLFLKLESLGESRASSKGTGDLVSKIIPWLIAAAGLVYAITK